MSANFKISRMECEIRILAPTARITSYCSNAGDILCKSYGVDESSKRAPGRKASRMLHLSYCGIDSTLYDASISYLKLYVNEYKIIKKKIADL